MEMMHRMINVVENQLEILMGLQSNTFGFENYFFAKHALLIDYKCHQMINFCCLCICIFLIVQNLNSEGYNPLSFFF